jgi:crotonobetainyl-CoA:carnitine CoA-transferase CaiB-like acyl-CoA transferase
MHHPTVGTYRGVGRPLKMSASPGPEPFAAPALGQHAEEVLRRHGYSDEQLAELRKQKVIPD